VNYRPDIDGLRGIAVMAVVMHHAFPALLPGGFVGVDIFFVISGYLITSDIVARQGAFSLADFYRRRVRRIFPALLVVLTGTAAIGAVLLMAHELESLMRHTVASAFFVQNFNLLGEVGYFDTEAQLKPLLHLWSLSIEEQFYLLWPLVLMACPAKWLLRLTVYAALASLSLMCLWPDVSAAYYLPFTRFWQILAGAVLAVAGVSRPSLALPGLLLCAAGIFGIERDMPALAAIIPTLGAVLVIAGRTRLLEARWLVGVGLISYPLYLWHWPLLAYLRIVGDVWELQTVAVVLFAVLLSSLTYRLIERPIRAGRRVVPPLVAGMACLAAASTVVAANPMLQSVASIQVAKVNDLRTVKPAGAECDVKVHRPHECIRDGRRFLLIGDSHAQALMPGLMAEQPGQWSLIWAPGCAPADAPGLNQRVCPPFAEVMKSAAGFEVVVLAFRDYYPTLPQEIGKTVQALKGKRVVVLTSVPDLPFHPRACVPRPGAEKIDCAFDRAPAQTKQAALRAAVLASGAELVDVLDTLCDGPRCAIDRGDMLMYRDGDHLSVRGARPVGRQVIAAIASRG
jgi:peptidoglycan/LPS O-acetylase OafA/YrhL